MINFNPNVVPVRPGGSGGAAAAKTQGTGKADFAEAVKNLGKQVQKVDQNQQSADASITELLAGKNQDINSVVSEVARADMSFKLLVGVRNKLVEAYKQTMNMPI